MKQLSNWIYHRVNVHVDVENLGENPRKVIYKWLMFHIYVTLP